MYTLFHLSHTDLDGYGCQFVTKRYFKNIKFYNSNYGKEIDERFSQIIDNIKAENAAAIVLITDLNLTSDQARSFEREISNLNQKVKLLLLDHHQSGQSISERYPWYFLDTGRCAAKITYDFFSSVFGKNDELERLTDVINAVDIWLSHDKNFELGKVCLSLISYSKELNRIMFDEANTAFMFSLLEQSLQFFDKKDAPQIELENNILAMKKNFFRLGKDDTLGNLVSNYNVMLLGKLKDKMSINYKGYKGILTFNISSVSIIGNEFLTQNSDFDFFMDVTSRKNVSFRANGKADVSKIASELANGGGHKNASGGSIETFRDSFSYEIVKKQINDLIKSKEVLK